MAVDSLRTAGTTTGTPRHTGTRPGRLRVGRAALAALVLAAATVAMSLGVAVTPAGATTATEQRRTADSQSVETTSTLPVDNRVQGNSITRPNQGADPLNPGEPGGWLQVSLFFLITAAVILMAVAVWWSSRRARLARAAAGLDPAQVATAKGIGVRTARMPADSGHGAEATGADVDQHDGADRG